jgi:acetyl esterase/lipase
MTIPLPTSGGWVCLLVAVAVGTAHADDTPFGKQTFIYKTAGNTPIKADVYRAEDTKVRPVLVWIHGGALIMGSRDSVPRDLRELCRAERYVLVSLDYRLAPETKLPAIIEDVQDAFRWLRAEAPRLFHAETDKMVVAGGSAGGYLTMMTGICVKPAPRALVAYWGYGDVDGEWYTKPSDFYRKQTLVKKEEAYGGVGGPVKTGGEGSRDDQRARGRYYLYLRQNGLWTKRAKLDPYCPVRNLSAAYPPILMVHGTADTDVPYEKSAELAAELARLKVAHELVTVPSAGHGLSGGDKKLVQAALERARDFIRNQLK